MRNVACPECAGEEVSILAPGRYRCKSEVVYFEEVLVDDPMARIAYGTPGMRRERVRKVRICGHEFHADAPMSGEICIGTRDGTACGAYAVGVCQGSGCGRPVCSRHGTYVRDRLECARCASAEEVARAARDAQNALERKRVETESANARATAVCQQLANATDPVEILAVIRDFKPGIRNPRIGPWDDPDHRQRFLNLLVPAWQRYLTARSPEHPHELATFQGYAVPRRAGNPMSSVKRIPCWVQRHDSDEWAYTADTAYHLGSGYQDWGNWSSPPVLRGVRVVCTGVLPQSFKVYGRRHLYHCFEIMDSRPLTGSDVLGLVNQGHQEVSNHGSNPRAPFQ